MKLVACLILEPADAVLVDRFRAAALALVDETTFNLHRLGQVSTVGRPFTHHQFKRAAAHVRDMVSKARAPTAGRPYTPEAKELEDAWDALANCAQRAYSAPAADDWSESGCVSNSH